VSRSLTSSRSLADFRMAGGDPGVVGANWWLRKNKNGKGFSKINLGPMNQCHMKAGDHIVISMCITIFI
jgi:5-oxoprolinase (ATP-hydrolysing)